MTMVVTHFSIMVAHQNPGEGIRQRLTRTVVLPVLAVTIGVLDCVTRSRSASWIAVKG